VTFDSPEVQAGILSYCREYSAAFMLVLDDKGLILEANQYASKLTGRNLPGISFHDIIVDFSGNQATTLLPSSANQSTLLNISTSSGLPQTFYFHFQSLSGGVLAIGEQNSLEIERLRESLSMLNAESANLNRELHKKNAELNKLNEIKNQFVGMAAHDLRNPIGGIFSLSDFLLEHSAKALSEEQKEILGMIKVSSSFMLRLLDDLLSIAKMEMGKLNLDLQSLEVSPFLKRIIKLNQILADRKQVILRLHDYDTIPPLVFDAMKIEQVLNNLISNAIKFSPAEAAVDIAVFQNGEYVIFTVSDRGPGIPLEDIDKIFKPFAKIGVKLPAGEKSTGLGLSIAQKIVLGHLGTIWYDKRQGGGSSLCFSLPVHRPNQSSDAVGG